VRDAAPGAEVLRERSTFTRLYVDEGEIVTSNLSAACAGLLSPDLQTMLESER
jgi:hypothetical protein